MHREVMEYQKIHTITDNVQQALTDLQQGIGLLLAAKQRLTATLGHENTYYDTLWESRISDGYLDEQRQASVAHVTKNAWRYVVKQTGITAYMTEKRQQELTKQIEKGDLPSLTPENILSTLEALSQQTPALLEESVREVFDWLRPRYSHGVGALKTNKKYRLGYKVIIGHAVTRYWHDAPWEFNSYREANFRTLGNVFALLDGQGVERYPQDFVTRCRMSWKSGTLPHADQYFCCMPYKNNNLHVTFLRHDLVDRINQIAGDLTLRDPAHE